MSNTVRGIGLNSGILIVPNILRPIDRIELETRNRVA